AAPGLCANRLASFDYVGLRVRGGKRYHYRLVTGTIIGNRGTLMLSLRGAAVRLCDQVTRREVLRLGGLVALGLSLRRLLDERSVQAASGRTSPGLPRSFGQAKSCIVLFLMGAPPQHSTWDPKPNAPANVRGDFGPISTVVPGTQICEL